MIQEKHIMPLVKANNCTLEAIGSRQVVANFFGPLIQKNIEFQSSYCEQVAFVANSHKELIEMLQEAKLQIEYLQSKFQETGSGNAVLSNIDILLKKEQEFYK